MRISDWSSDVCSSDRQVHRETLSAAAGIIIFQPVRLNHTHALPHKLFDYMRAAIPVIVPGFAVEVAQIVLDADCGLIVDPTDAAAVADAMNRLLRDRDSSEDSRVGNEVGRTVR